MKVLTSLSLTTVCLILLLILTFFGTLYQTDNGLYRAQQVFFNSWFLFFPFPGAKLVLMILGVNLLSVLLLVLKYSWKKSGLVLMHWGLTLLVVGSGITYYFAQESILTLSEGEVKTSSVINSIWELKVSQERNGEKITTAVSVDLLKPGTPIALEAQGVTVVPEVYYINAGAFQDTTGWQQREGVLPVNLNAQKKYINGSGITSIREREPVPEISQNIPGMLFLTGTLDNSGTKEKVLLSGYETEPTMVTIGSKDYWFHLSRTTVPLPIAIKLIDFVKTDHPGISMAKAYESTVAIEENGIQRELKISMNEPLRTHGFTFFQSSFSKDGMGREVSIFQVVENPGRVIPYLSSIIIGFGLLLHFILLLINRLKKERV
ncbi:MAG: cytochrome c biogenesis protein ResB [Fibrobacterales bacterium]